MKIVGWSSGAFHAAGRNAENALHDNLLVGANAFELSFLSVDELAAFDLAALPAWKERLAPLAFRSLHAPVKGIERWDAETSLRWQSKLRDICQALLIDSLVFHVEQVDDPEMPWFVGLPVSVENADRKSARKMQGGRELEPLRQVLRAGHRITFDLEHAAKHSSTLVYTHTLWKRLHQIRHDAVDHFHLSGPTAEGARHGLVYESPGGAPLVDFAAEHSGVPVILEGRLTAFTVDDGNIAAQLRKELSALAWSPSQPAQKGDN